MPILPILPSVRAGPASREEASRSLGLAGAKQYVATRLGFKIIYERQRLDADDLDIVARDGDAYLVVAALGPDCQPNSCPIPNYINADTNEPWWAMEGSLKYLEIMLASMQQSSDSHSKSMACELLSALLSGKLRYNRVQTCFNTDGEGLYFEDTKFDLSKE